MSLRNSSTSSSEARLPELDEIRRPMRDVLTVSAWVIGFLVGFEVAVNSLFPYPTDPRQPPSGRLVVYLDYGRSIEGKIRRLVGPTDETSGPLRKRRLDRRRRHRQAARQGFAQRRNARSRCTACRSPRRWGRPWPSWTQDHSPPLRGARGPSEPFLRLLPARPRRERTRRDTRGPRIERRGTGDQQRNDLAIRRAGTLHLPSVSIDTRRPGGTLAVCPDAWANA